MSKKYWKNGDEVGVVQDSENKKITLFAGKTSIELDGKDNRVVISGPVTEMNGGDRTEEVLIKKQAGVMSFIPSTTVTPVPQGTINIPIQGVSNLISDIAKMIALLG